MSELNNISHNTADLSEFKKLQKRLNYEGIRNQFRTKVVGGLNEEDVTNYILSLEEKLKKSELDNKKTSDEIFNLRSKLNTELETKDSLLTNIDELKQNLKTYMDECNQKDSAIASFREKHNLESVLMKSEIQHMTESKKELEKTLNESFLEINEIKTKLVDFEQINKELKQNNNRLTEEKEELERKLSVSCNEIDCINNSVLRFENENNQLKNIVLELKNDNNSLNARISQISKEYIQASVLNEEKIKMAEEFKAYEALMADEIKAYEDLLNQAIVKYDELKEYADRYENENANLKEKIAEIEETITAKDYKISEINRTCIDLKHQLEIEKSFNEKINMDLVIFKQKIISLQDTINSNLAELDEQKKKTQDAEMELNIEKAKVVSYKINGFRDELVDIYEKIASLEFEAKQYLETSTMLQQQLTIQKNRADKAEYDLGTFMEILSGVKEKFYNDHINLDEEFAKLFAKRINQSEGNKLIVNFD